MTWFVVVRVGRVVVARSDLRKIAFLSRKPMTPKVAMSSLPHYADVLFELAEAVACAAGR
jgi:hypothetical protein